MTRLLPLFVCLSILVGACVTSKSEQDDKEVNEVKDVDYGPLSTIRPARIRALWVDSWGPGFYNDEEIARLIRDCESWGINTILAEVRKTGDAYYHSELEPRGRLLPGGATLPANYDPLERLIAAARPKGIRVEAWIVANRIAKGTTPPPASHPPHIQNSHPEWLLRNEAGQIRDGAADPSVFIDPASLEATAHLARVAADLALRYRIDAIHLDYIRYPGAEWGYTKNGLQRFQNECGRSDRPQPTDPEFLRWRSQRVDEQVQMIRKAIKNAAARVELTAATLTWGEIGAEGYLETRGYTDAAQNWPLWCQQGWIDVNYLMHYKREHDPRWAKDFRRWLDVFEDHRASTSTRFVVGVGAYLNDVTGSRAQLRAVWKRPSFDGVAVFSYRGQSRTPSDVDAFGKAFRESTR